MRAHYRKELRPFGKNARLHIEIRPSRPNGGDRWVWILFNPNRAVCMSVKSFASLSGAASAARSMILEVLGAARFTYARNGDEAYITWES